jgi:hypothetical protein
VTAVGDGPDTNSLEACKDLSHNDVFTEDDGAGGDGEFFKETDCHAVFPIYSEEAVECSIFITCEPGATTDVDLLIVDAIPGEFNVEFIDLSEAIGTDARSLPQGHGGATATRIEWYIPSETAAGTYTLQVDIATVESSGKGHGKKEQTVFKPTSCGPLPLNEGATAYEFVPGTTPNEIEDGEIVKENGEAVIVDGPTNQLESQAVEGTKPCEPEGLTVIKTGNLGELYLVWTDNVDDDVVQYNIYRSTTPGGPYRSGQFVTSVAGTFMYKDTGLADGTEYCYVVKAEDGDGDESNESEEACATTPVPVVEP